MFKTVVLNVAGLTPRHIGPHTPALRAWAQQGRLVNIRPVLPVLTGPAQATYLTGTPPSRHGIVANGWYFRDECEIKFYRQSNRLVERRKLWETARLHDANFTCANLFWWYNMYASADISVAPRPSRGRDGSRIADIYTRPGRLRYILQERLGRFPQADLWGPEASIRSSEWIASAARVVENDYAPTLTLVYLPHLDVALQRLGPNCPAVATELGLVDRLCGQLIHFYEQRGAKVLVLSDYGIMPVKRAVALNRVLRREGYIALREEFGQELLDPGASTAFAVTDHQIAHVYVQDPQQISTVRNLLEKTPGVAAVYGRVEQAAHHFNHYRCGELVALAAEDAWFSYYYWFDSHRAPNFARTVDSQRKPGYDPAELFYEPNMRWPRLTAALQRLRRRLGGPPPLDLIPLEGAQVRGSFGRAPACADDAPLLITRDAALLNESPLAATDVHNLILAHLFGAPYQEEVAEAKLARIEPRRR